MKNPNKRLKDVREITKLTQRKLAELCGVSYSYYLAVESGQRAITEGIAARISVATGVSKDWLMDKDPREKPQSYWGEYTEENWERRHRWERLQCIKNDFGDVGDELMMSDEVIDQLAVALRAAWKVGKFRVGVLMIHDLLDEMKKDLKLTARMIEERGYDVPTSLVDEEYKGEGLGYPNMLHHVLPLMSPYGRYKWHMAFSEGGEKRERFVEELEDLVAMVSHSFTLEGAARA